jgi:hypothetical protein
LVAVAFQSESTRNSAVVLVAVAVAVAVGKVGILEGGTADSYREDS